MRLRLGVRLGLHRVLVGAALVLLALLVLAVPEAGAAAAPQTYITLAPAKYSNDSSPTFRFKSNQRGSKFQCKLDSYGWKSCTSPRTYSAVRQGSHKFQVRAIKLGRADPTPAKYPWRIDLTQPLAPTVAESSLDSHLNGATLSYRSTADPGSVVLSATAVDSGGAGIANVVFPGFPAGSGFLPETGFADTTSPFSRPYTWAGGTIFDGSATVTAYDRAGNFSTTTVTLAPDGSAPVTVDDSSPGWHTTDQSITLSPTDDKSGVAATYYTTDGTDPATSATRASGTTVSLAADGMYTIRYFSVDNVSNTESTKTTDAIKIDKSNPSGSIIQPAADAAVSGAVPVRSDSADAGSGVERVDFQYAPLGIEAWTLIGSDSTNSYEVSLDTSALADGGYRLRAITFDNAGNAFTSPELDFSVDNTAPGMPDITNTPLSPTKETAATFTFTSDDPTVTFRCALESGLDGDFSSCTSPKSYSGLSDGAHTFYVKAVDPAGNMSRVRVHEWTVDATGPATTFTRKPGDPNSSKNAVFEFTSEVGATFECSLGDAGFSSCTSPQTFAGLSDGPHTFRVHALDALGNVGATASHTWTIDTTGPATTITSKPLHPTSATNAGFEFTSEAGATFECKLDDQLTFSLCVSPKVYLGPLAEGSHTFRVRAIDTLGNAGPAETYVWAIDLTGPATTITSRPADPTNSTSASFDFTSEVAATFECSLDSTTNFSSCTSPKVYLGPLSEGSHTFRVRATDVLGNLGPVGSYTWTIDRTGPLTMITSKPADPTDATSASFEFTSEVGATYECSLDSTTNFSSCTSPKVYLGPLSEGSHTFRVRATDALGNAGPLEAYTWQLSSLNTADARKRVVVGPGVVDASVRQVVRTAGGRVYIFAADDTAQKQDSGPGVIRAWKANRTGIPTAFAEMDGGNRPSATGVSVLGSPDVRLNSSGLVQLLYIRESTRELVYQTFSTASDTWGTAEIVATGVTAPGDFHAFRRAQTANALILDDDDVPHVVYTAGSSVLYRNRIGGSWSAATTVATGSSPIHPQLAAEPNGDIHLAWLEQASGNPTIRYAKRTAGTWGAAETVAAGVLSNDNLDQGPSIILNESGTPYVLYMSCCAPDTTYVRVKYKSAGSWVFDTMPTDLYAHTPQIYGRGNDIYTFLGHDDEVRFGYAFHLTGEPWAPYQPLTTLAEGRLDGSASVRWDPVRETNANVIDAAFFDEDKRDDSTWLPELYYMGVLPSSSGGGGGDTQSPSVSITEPADDATLSGTVTVAADASDDVGVSGVRFTVNGRSLGSEDTTAPYAMSWNTLSFSDGVHIISAVARDAAGNVGAAADVTVTVDNSAPPPGGGVLLGNETIHSNVDFNPAGTAEAFRVTGGDSGTLNTISVYIDASSTATILYVGLYSNNGGHPADWLTEGSLFDSEITTGAWNTVSVAPVSIAAGTDYWIVLLTPTGSGTIKFRDIGNGAGTSPAETSAETDLNFLPGTWSTGAVYMDGPLSSYGSG
jgi:hypothetical protein